MMKAVHVGTIYIIGGGIELEFNYLIICIFYLFKDLRLKDIILISLLVKRYYLNFLTSALFFQFF